MKLLNTFSALFLFWLFSLTSINAQIAITSEDIMALIGTSRSALAPNQDSAIVSVDLGDPGENKIWDFSSMQIVSAIEGDQEFIGPEDGYQNDLFPEANFVQRFWAETEEGNFLMDSYFFVNQSVYQALGSASNFAGFSSTEQYSNDAAPMPLTYGTSWLATSNDTSEQIGFVSITVDTTFNSVDAWGTLRLPSGDFECLRLRQQSKTTTSTTFNGTPLGTETTESVNFTWISKNHLQTITVDSTENGMGEVTVMITESSATSVDDKVNIAAGYELKQNYPNPFNPATKISYSIAEGNNVSLRIFDILGNEITQLVDEFHSKGNYNVEFDGSGLASGVYFYTLKAGSFTQTKKMILLE